MAIISLKDLPAIRAKHKGEKIVFCSGTFDLTHVGHILFFEDCKKLGDILVVAVGNDLATRRYKGDTRPVLNEAIRLKTVDTLKPVDYCIVDSIPTDPELKGNLLAMLFPIFDGLRPDIWAINEDAFDKEYRKELAQKYGMKLHTMDRWCPQEFENISTTKIIDRVKGLT